MRNITFFFMPPWPGSTHNYTIALFESLTRDSGFIFRGANLNTDLYNAVDDSKKYLWDLGSRSEDWYIHEVYTSIFNDNYDFLKDYFSRFIDSDTAACGMSVRTESLLFAYLCAKYIRSEFPYLPIIFGGPACFTECHYTKILHDESSISAIVSGEGEYAWELYLKHLSNQQIDTAYLPKIPGMIYRTPTGELLDCGPVKKIYNFNSLKNIDYSRLTINGKNSHIYPLETSRGCVNHCAFCSERNNYFPYRTKSSVKIVEEITGIVEHFSCNRDSNDLQYPHITFQDSLINGNMRVFEGWMDSVIASGLRFSWTGMAILRKEMTISILEKMRKSGCDSIMWGLESGSQITLRNMNKTLFTPAMAKEIFKVAHALGIKNIANIIVGFPTETEDNFMETMSYVEEIKPFFHVLGTSAMLILPNAPVYKNANKFNIQNPDMIADWISQGGKNTLKVREERLKRLQSILDSNQMFNARKLSSEKKFFKCKLYFMFINGLEKLMSTLKRLLHEHQ